MSERSYYKRRCPAMRKAGIEDPESHEGIVFCTGDKETESKCPYSVCIVFEFPENPSALKAKARGKFAGDLYEHGVSVEDIALIVGKSTRTVQRYLGEIA